jgi:heat shock protein HtpX
MEMCLDNPREGFENLFDTHPSVDRRVAALVQYAGGHDPGPLALPDLTEPTGPDEKAAPAEAPDGPAPSKPPLLPSDPPAVLGGGTPAGPWGPPRGS